MKYAVISDVHANLEALEAVLEDIERIGVDEIICLGDRVGYGPSVDEVLEKMKDIPTVQGNHDHTIANMDPQDQNWKNTHPTTKAIWISQVQRITSGSRAKLDNTPQLRKRINEYTGGTIYFAHAGINLGKDYPYIKLEPENKGEISAEQQMEQINIGDILFIGHSHIPGIYRNYMGFKDDERTKRHLSGKEKRQTPIITYEQVTHPRRTHIDEETRRLIKQDSRKAYGEEIKTIVNIGSTGQPRDKDWRASYALYDSEKGRIVYRRVPYDIEKTFQKIQEQDWDQRVKNRQCRRLVNGI